MKVYFNFFIHQEEQIFQKLIPLPKIWNYVECHLIHYKRFFSRVSLYFSLWIEIPNVFIFMLSLCIRRFQFIWFLYFIFVTGESVYFGPSGNSNGRNSWFCSTYSKSTLISYFILINHFCDKNKRQLYMIMCMDSFVIVVVVMYLDKQTNKQTNWQTDRQIGWTSKWKFKHFEYFLSMNCFCFYFLFFFLPYDFLLLTFNWKGILKIWNQIFFFFTKSTFTRKTLL